MPRMRGYLIEATEESFEDRDTGRPVEFVRLLLKVPTWGSVRATCGPTVLEGLNGSRASLDEGVPVEVDADVELRERNGRYAFKVHRLAEV